MLCSSLFFFFFNDTATTEIYTLSLHDALPISRHHGLLAGDGGELGHGGLERLRVLGRIPHPHVEHDLHELRDLVGIRQPELLRQLRPHALLVILVQTWRRRGLDGRAFRLGRSGPLTLPPLLAPLLVPLPPLWRPPGP